MILQAPWALLLLLILPVLIWRYYKGSLRAGVRFSDVEMFTACPISLRQRLRGLLFWLRITALALMIFALARPREGTAIESISTEGVAMQIVVDRSSSMSEQMTYGGRVMNRLEVVKRVAKEFVFGNDKELKGRPYDMIGLISFSRYADTLCPLIHSHDVLGGFLDEIQLAQSRSQEDGTAIGAAIQLAAARLQKAEQQILENNKRVVAQSDSGEPAEPEFTIKSKIIILLTDGQETIKEVDPIEATQLAAEWGIKIYTIGVGEPVNRGIFGFVDGLDERLLRAIAQATGGFFGRAGNDETLRAIYEKIDKLETTEVKSLQFVDYAEKFWPWALAGLILLVVEIVLDCTVLRKAP